MGKRKYDILTDDEWDKSEAKIREKQQKAGEARLPSLRRQFAKDKAKSDAEFGESWDRATSVPPARNQI